MGIAASLDSQQPKRSHAVTKERSPKKETKKKPAHTLKEKRAAKKSKHEGGGGLGTGR